MKLKTIALTSAFALASTFALAQSSTGGGSTSGAPAATKGSSMDTKSPTGTPQGDAAMQQNMGTTGSSRPSAAGDASTSGAGTAAGPNTTGDRTEPGAVQKGVNSK